MKYVQRIFKSCDQVKVLLVRNLIGGLLVFCNVIRVEFAICIYSSVLNLFMEQKFIVELRGFIDTLRAQRALPNLAIDMDIALLSS